MSFKTKVAAGLVVLGLALTGCGSAPAATTTPGQTVTIRFTWWGNETRNKLTTQVIAAFEKANPTIKVQAEPG